MELPLDYTRITDTDDSDDDCSHSVATFDDWVDCPCALPRGEPRMVFPGLLDFDEWVDHLRDPTPHTDFSDVLNQATELEQEMYGLSSSGEDWIDWQTWLNRVREGRWEDSDSESDFGPPPLIDEIDNEAMDAGVEMNVRKFDWRKFCVRPACGPVKIENHSIFTTWYGRLLGYDMPTMRQ